MVQSFLKDSLGKHPRRNFLIFWLIICTSLSFVVGGITKQTVKQLYDVKYQQMDEINQVLYNLDAETYQICYANKEIADVIELTKVKLVATGGIESKGMELIKNTRKVLNCSNENAVKIFPCTGSRKVTKHCYIEGHSNMLRLINDDNNPRIIEYHSRGKEELNTEKLLFLPVAVLLDLVVVPYSILVMLLFATVSYRG